MGKKKLEHIVFDNSHKHEFDKRNSVGKSFPFPKQNTTVMKHKSINSKRGK